MIRWPARWFVVAAGAAATACGLVIGLDDKPARPGPSGPDASSEAAAPDAGDVAPSFCDLQDAAFLFCEDFDRSGPPFQRWRGFAAAPPYAQGGEAGIEIVPFDAAASQPNVALTTGNVVQEGVRSAAALTSTLDGRGAHALELSLSVIVDDVVDHRPEKPDAAGPDGGAPDGANPDWDLVSELQVVTGGIGALVNGEPGAAIFLFTPSDMALAVVDDQTTKLTLGPTDKNYGRFGNVSLASFRGVAWSRVTVLLGERGRVTARAAELFGAAPDCPPVLAVALAGSDVTFSTTKCIATRDELANVGTYPVIVSAGVSMTQVGTVRMKLDDITVRAVP